MSSRKSPTESATLYKIGTKKKGNDNNIWIIVENKNGIKRWKLYKIDTKINTNIRLDSVSFYEMYNMPRLTITPKNLETWIKPYDTIKRERFFYFLNVIIPQIQKLGIKIFTIPLGQAYDTGFFYIDTMHKILEDLYNYSYDDFYSNDTLVPVLNITTKNQLADNYIYIYHTKLSGKLKTQLISLFKKKFPNNYYWNGTNKTAILIFL